MSKHTPGPWIVYDDSNDGKTNRMEIAAIGKTVARIYNSVPEEDLPNARLIAASPDLLAVLKELQESAAYWSEYDVPIGIVDRINQAIAKAEGA